MDVAIRQLVCVNVTNRLVLRAGVFPTSKEQVPNPRASLPTMATITRYWNAQCVESRSRLREGTLQWFSARICTLRSRQILFLHDCRKACCLQVHMVTKKSLHKDVIRVVEGREFVIIMAIAVVVSSQKSSIPFYPMLPIVGLVGFAQML